MRCPKSLQPKNRDMKCKTQRFDVQFMLIAKLSRACVIALIGPGKLME